MTHTDVMTIHLEYEEIEATLEGKSCQGVRFFIEDQPFVDAIEDEVGAWHLFCVRMHIGTAPNLPYATRMAYAFLDKSPSEFYH